MERLARTVARNSTAGLVAQLAIKLCSFAFSVLIVRKLGAEEFGQYAAVLAFAAVFVFLADLGLSPYTVREVARYRDVPDGLRQIRGLYGDVLALRFLLALVAAGCIVGTAVITGRPLVMVIAITLGTVGLIMYSLHGTCEALLSGHERVDITAGARVAYQVVFVTIGAAVILLGMGYYGLIGANLLGIALMTWLCWRAVHRLGLQPASLQIVRWPALLRASLPFGVIGLTLGLSYRFDSVLLNVTRGDVETGYYNAAYNLVFTTTMLSNVINTSLYPSLSREYVSRPEHLPAVYERVLRYLLVIALPIAVGASLLAEPLTLFLFGVEYGAAAPALRVLIWVVPLMFVSEFLGYIVVIAGREGRIARAIMISTGFNITLNLLLVPRYGFLAAAVMTLVTEAVLVGQYVWMLRATLARMRWIEVLIRPALAAGLMGLLVYALQILPLLVVVVVGAVSYTLLLVALRVIGPTEWQFVRALPRSPFRSKDVSSA